MSTAANFPPSNARFSSDAERWQAVRQRNRAADGCFIYSVKTTGVYCRPGCGARLANRENVQFHATPAAAARAGFRPCKRCRPAAASRPKSNATIVAKACALIAAAEAPLTLPALASAVGLSPSHLQRVFKEATGVTPKGYANALRAKKLRSSLVHGRSVTNALLESGFQSVGPFHAASRQLLGMTASAFRNGGAGESIRFAVGECSLGSILVAATNVGVCEISLGDDPETLVRDLQDRFSQSTLLGGDRKFDALIAHVVGFVERPAAPFDLPLDVKGTAFQQRVWQLLRKIPCGKTATYSEIARRLGRPTAVRAVAHACAANRLAVAIPCHRVVRTDGSLSGYRWGISRKAELLERERLG